MVSEDGEHGTGWLEVQRLPQELWGGVPPRRLPLRRLEHVFSEEEAAPLLKEELLKVSRPMCHTWTSAASHPMWVSAPAALLLRVPQRCSVSMKSGGLLWQAKLERAVSADKLTHAGGTALRKL